MRFPRLLGAATAAYGAAIIASPALLLKPSGMLRDGKPEPEQAAFVRVLGVRDLASGLAMVLPPAARPCARRSPCEWPRTRATWSSSVRH